MAIFGKLNRSEDEKGPSSLLPGAPLPAGGSGDDPDVCQVSPSSLLGDEPPRQGYPKEDVTDFTDFCLKTTCTGGTVLGAMNSGFGGPTTVGLGSTVGLNANSNGRYLVVSGQLPNGGDFEKFKIKSTGGYGQAPEPESLALIGIGLLAMLGLRRRSSNTSGRIELTSA